MRTAIIAMIAVLSFPALAEEPAAGDADRPEDGEQEVTVVVTAAKHGQKITAPRRSPSSRRRPSPRPA